MSFCLILNESLLFSVILFSSSGKLIRDNVWVYYFLLITDNNKLLIFGKFNSPLLIHSLIVDLLYYKKKLKYIHI